MPLDREDFANGGMTLHNPGMNPWDRRWLPFSLYKLTPEYEQNQMLKPQHDTRDPDGIAVKRWEVQGGTCVEMRGTRSWFGQCVCGCWIYSARDVSTYEFRGRKNTGPKGKWPKYCTGCRERRDQERADQSRRAMSKLRATRNAQRDKLYAERGWEPVRQGVRHSTTEQAECPWCLSSPCDCGQS